MFTSHCNLSSFWRVRRDGCQSCFQLKGSNLSTVSFHKGNLHKRIFLHSAVVSQLYVWMPRHFSDGLNLQTLEKVERFAAMQRATGGSVLKSCRETLGQKVWIYMELGFFRVFQGCDALFGLCGSQSWNQCKTKAMTTHAWRFPTRHHGAQYNSEFQQTTSAPFPTCPNCQFGCWPLALRQFELALDTENCFTIFLVKLVFNKTPLDVNELWRPKKQFILRTSSSHWAIFMVRGLVYA